MGHTEDSTDNTHAANPGAFYTAVRADFAPLPASASWTMADGGLVFVAFTEERAAALLEAIGTLQDSNGRIEDTALQRLARANQHIEQLEMALLSLMAESEVAESSPGR